MDEPINGDLFSNGLGFFLFWVQGEVGENLMLSVMRSPLTLERNNVNLLLARVHYINKDFLMYKDRSLYILKRQVFLLFCKRHFGF